MQLVPLELHSAELVQLNMAVLSLALFYFCSQMSMALSANLHHNPLLDLVQQVSGYFPKTFAKNRGLGGKDYYVAPTHLMDYNSKTISISVLYIHKEHYSSRDTRPICLRT